MGSRGFSFTEILFAVMILGIGFIMVAAMFPVAIQQTQNSGDETVGAAIARGGVSFFTQAMISWPPQPTAAFPQTSILTPTFPMKNGSIVPQSYPSLNGLPFGTTFNLPGRVFSCYDQLHDNQSVNGAQHYLDLWNLVSPNMIQASDPRYAWVALYRRDYQMDRPFATNGNPFALAPYAQVIAIAVRARNTQTYGPTDLTEVNAGVEPSLIPSPGQATLNVTTLPNGSVLSSTISIVAGSNAALRAAEGAYVVIASDNLAPSSSIHGQLNGHVYRLGVARPDVGANAWEFAPGEGPSAGDALLITTGGLGGSTFDIFIVGKGQDPNNPGQYIGPAQDVAVYSTFVPCPN